MIVSWMVVSFRRVTSAGSVRREVTCEHCGTAYSYVLYREYTQDVPLVFPGMMAHAKRTSERTLARILERGVDVVSCPACRGIQTEMIPELRRRFLRAFRVCGVYVFWGFLGVLAMVLVCGAYVWVRKENWMDIDLIGIVLACLGGSALGAALVGMQKGLAGLRYRLRGFVPRRAMDLRARRGELGPAVVTDAAE